MDRLATTTAGAYGSSIVDADLPLIPVSSVAPEGVEWLWPGRFALGKVTLLAGDPGQGKSLLTVDMAARVSRGGAWPDEKAEVSGVGGANHEAPVDVGLSGSVSRSERKAGSAVIFCEEDDVDDTIRPRLDAHGADCDRVLIAPARSVRRDGDEWGHAFDMSRDLPRLERMLERLPDCRLVVIDPIIAYLGRCVENTNSEVRGVLGPLRAIASRRHVAVVAVTHLRKKEGAALYRALGSLAFVAASRAAWLACSDPEDAERHLFLPLKNNLGGERRGLAYRIESRGPLEAALVCWEEGEVIVTAESAVGRAPRSPRAPGRPDDERAEAAGWLERFLAAGPQPAGVVREAAEGHGFAYGTIRRAFRQLEGESMRQGEGDERRWLWKLPSTGVGATKGQRQAG